MNICRLPIDDDCTSGAEALARMRRLHPAPRQPIVWRPAPPPPEPPAPSKREIDTEATLVRVAEYRERMRVLEERRARLTEEERTSQREIYLTITTAVCALWGIEQNDLICRRLEKRFVEPRHVAFALMCRLTIYSLPQIGGLMGGRDHTTVLSAKRKMQWVIDQIATESRHEMTPEEWVEAAFFVLHREAGE